jgi:hypothetical protein
MAFASHRRDRALSDIGEEPRNVPAGVFAQFNRVFFSALAEAGQTHVQKWRNRDLERSRRYVRFQKTATQVIASDIRRIAAVKSHNISFM